MTFEELQRRGYELTRAEYMAGRGEMIRVLRRSLDDIRGELRKLYDKLEGVSQDELFNEAVKYERLSSLEKQVGELYRRSAREAGRNIEGHAKTAIANSYYRQQFAAQFSLSTTDASMAFAVLSDDVIEASVYGTQEVWRNRFGVAQDYVPKSGALLRSILDENRQADVRRLRRAITASLTQGESYTKASRRVKNILDTSASNAVRIMRTEGHRNALAGQYALKRHAQEEGVEARRRIVAVMDDRTRPQSAQVDGRVENEDGLFEYPGGVMVRTPGNSGVARWDINDRESTVMDIGGVEPTVRRGRNPATGENEIMSFRGFEEWRREHNLTKNRYGQIMES